MKKKIYTVVIKSEPMERSYLEDILSEDEMEILEFEEKEE